MRTPRQPHAPAAHAPASDRSTPLGDHLAAAPDRIDPRSALVVMGAALLIASLFLEWYAPGLEAWAVFEIVDILLLAIGVAAIAAVLPAAIPALRGGLPFLIGAALLLVTVSVIDPPPAASGAEREIGAWLALAAVLLMALGWALAYARISVRVDLRDASQGHTPADTPPGDRDRHPADDSASSRFERDARPARPETSPAAPSAEDPTQQISRVP